MAFFTYHDAMFSDERKACFRMGKGCCLPFPAGVAVVALLPELSSMFVFMTIPACGFKAQVRPLLHRVRFLEDFLLNKVRGRMALFACPAGVFSRQFEPRLFVIELRRIPANKLEVPAVMLLVTGGALELLREGVISEAVVYPGFYFDMAGEAVISKCPVAEIMALGAAVDSFQLFMHRRKFPRGYKLRTGVRQHRDQ